MPEGEHGEVAFTTLTREGMPLIRYRMGDRSRFIPGPCPCGTKLRTLEKVRGRFSGFIPAGEETLRLPDFDEALFPIPGLLNFSVTVAANGQGGILLIEAQTLTPQDVAPWIAQALRTIPSLRELKIEIRCQYASHETGSLHKRVIHVTEKAR